MADWKQISGGLTTISVGSRTHVWGINSLGQMYRYTGHDTNPWIGIPGKAVGHRRSRRRHRLARQLRRRDLPLHRRPAELTLHKAGGGWGAGSMGGNQADGAPRPSFVEATGGRGWRVERSRLCPSLQECAPSGRSTRPRFIDHLALKRRQGPFRARAVTSRNGGCASTTVDADVVPGRACGS